ncbi:MAG: phytanoyl-CoA dioxygenase [Acidimicrobiaceae bacterium]|nr:phytanoyl-CoA dioxygenase [Acidimicrobiaceae bacterium]
MAPPPGSPGPVAAASVTLAGDLADAFAADGAVHLPGAFTDWVDVLRDGVDRNEADPSEHFDDNGTAGDAGRFWDDYCNWTRIPEYERFAFESGVGDVAAALLRSDTIQLFHEHVLVKEPAAPRHTPWHCDAPYYFVDGPQTVSLWIPLDPVPVESTLRLVRGSHLWDEAVHPVSWTTGGGFYGDDTTTHSGGFQPAPDPDADRDRFEILEWACHPGDAVAFHYRTVHGARGSTGLRRAFSLRVVGDDSRYVQRPGRTSPPFDGHGMVDGQRLREDWFPLLPLGRVPAAT